MGSEAREPQRRQLRGVNNASRKGGVKHMELITKINRRRKDGSNENGRKRPVRTLMTQKRDTTSMIYNTGGGIIACAVSGFSQN